MTLAVELRASRTEFAFQESPALDFTLRNRGSAPIQLTHPGHSQSVPHVRLVNVASGREQVFTGHESFLPPRTQALAPGAAIEWSFGLEDKVELTDPGVYDLSLRYPFDDGRVAESNAVRLTVRPHDGEALALASVRGAPGPIWNAAWIDTASTPPQLLRGTLRLSGENPRFERVRALGAVAPGSRPGVSAAPNGSVSHDHWIAWVDGTRLRALHVGAQSGVTPAREIALGAGASLVAALASSPLVDPKRAPDGAALVLRTGGPAPELAVVELRANALALGAKSAWSGAAPVWIQSFTRTDGRRLVAAIGVEERRLALRSAPWPGERGSAARLAAFEGRLLGAGAAIDTSDRIQGALLVAPEGAQARSPLELIEWTLAADGGFAERGRNPVAWADAEPPAQVQVTVSSAGAAGLLLQTASGRHFSAVGGRELRAVSPAREAARPCALVFSSDYDALLVCAREHHGWQLARADGAPLGHGADAP